MDGLIWRELHFQNYKKIPMAIILLLLCVLPACIVSAHFAGNPFVVKGCVYCDTCLCGYETEASKYLSGAVVRIECRNRVTSELTYQKETVTDSKGRYTVLVETDCGDDYCDAVLVKSSEAECSKPDPGRDRARVILTRNNGITSATRYANAMAFLANAPLPTCPHILQKYMDQD